MTMPSSRCGTALTVSTSRISSRSVQPPTAPDNAPTTAPSTVEITTTSSATSSDTRSPARLRSSRSRPASSVPNGWARLGASRTAV